MNFEEIKNEVKSRMSQKRFEHCERVSENAARIARKFGLDEEKARWAGILHDVAKEYGDDKFLEIAEKNRIPVSDEERRNPHKLHGKIGAVIARDELGVTDKEILSGIASHFGRPGMSDFEEIIFLADIFDKSCKVGADMSIEKLIASETPDDAMLYMLNLNLKGQTLGYVKDEADVRLIYDYTIDKKMRASGSAPDTEEWLKKRETVCGDELFDKLIDVNIAHSVDVKSVKNIRDLGGYTTKSGAKVRTGKLIRSGMLCRLTQEDADKLYDMGINYVIDLRSEADQAAAPDKNIGKFHKVTCELSSIEKTDYQNEIIGLSKGLGMNRYHAEGGAWMNGEFLRDLDMEQMYKDILSSESSIEALRQMLGVLLRDDCTGAIIHCRDGKDRTGVVAIILLYILDVDVEDIAMDYMASAIPNFAITEIFDAYFSTGSFDDKIITNSTREKSVDRDLTIQIRDWFREKYGDMTAYLHDVLGLDDTFIDRMREKYCEH